ncbi:hypothetical protein [Dongia sp.]|uniref:hypothetical protein n=1 Tax=Dongia sp. TaxID=1977262 RepID=UPI0035ADC99D
MALFSKARRAPFGTDRDGDQPAVFGTWRDGRFDFTSPEARTAWHHAAYNQGIDPETWHLGREMDARTESVVAAGLGGSLPPTYRGPDGKMRFGSDKTIERPAIRAIRQRAFAGQRIDDIEAAYRDKRVLPDSVEAVAHLLGSSSASRSPATMPAHSNARLVGETTPTEVPPKMRLDISDVLRGEKKEEDYSRNPDLLLAQADTGTESEAGTMSPTSPPQLAAPQVKFPSGTAEPTYSGEKKAHGKRAAEAEALIQNLKPAEFWPVEGEHRLNVRREKDRQGDGRYGDTRFSEHTIHNGIDIAASVGTPVRGQGWRRCARRE